MHTYVAHHLIPRCVRPGDPGIHNQSINQSTRLKYCPIQSGLAIRLFRVIWYLTLQAIIVWKWCVRSCFLQKNGRRWPSLVAIFPQKAVPHTSLSHYNVKYQITRNSRIEDCLSQPNFSCKCSNIFSVVISFIATIIFHFINNAVGQKAVGEIDWEHPGIHRGNLITCAGSERVTDRVCSIK